MKKRKRRSVAVSRAASLKAWRTRRIMREKRLVGRELIWAFMKATADEPIHTIDCLPKVEWP